MIWRKGVAHESMFTPRGVDERSIFIQWLSFHFYPTDFPFIPSSNFTMELGRIKRTMWNRAIKQEKRKESKISRLSDRKPTKKRHHCRKKRTCKQLEYTVIITVTDKMVINLSNVNLSEDKRRLLSRGLTFCPRPSRIDKFQLKQDIRNFTRRLRLREFFHDQDEDNTTPIPHFRKKIKVDTSN